MSGGPGELLSLHGVGFGYPGGAPVLRGVDASFRAGRVTALVGPNGSGKTTMVRLLLGTRTPGAGRVVLRVPGQERDVAGMSARERAGRIAYVPQQPGVAEGFTVEQVVRMGRLARPRADGAVEGAMASAALVEERGRLYDELSAGQRQRVALARALAQLDGGDISAAEQAIVADEPVSAMDPRHAVASLELLRAQARAGRCVVVVLHDLTAALRFADDALVLDADGRVAAVGSAGEVLAPEVLRGVYGIGFERVRTEGGGVGAIVPAASVDFR